MDTQHIHFASSCRAPRKHGMGSRKQFTLFTQMSRANTVKANKKFSDELVDKSLPEVEASFCDKDVLIRIHCEKRKGVIEKPVAEVEKLQLLVINSSAMSFGSSALDITIIAQMDKEFNMTLKDLAKNLRANLK
ncbi:hypothetical protein LguiB_021436 [Lonicera macranthoides]